jgi:hypothetical protein
MVSNLTDLMTSAAAASTAAMPAMPPAPPTSTVTTLPAPASLPPFLAHLLNGGTAPYTASGAQAQFAPLLMRSAGAIFSGPVLSGVAPIAPFPAMSGLPGAAAPVPSPLPLVDYAAPPTSPPVGSVSFDSPYGAAYGPVAYAAAPAPSASSTPAVTPAALVGPAAPSPALDALTSPPFYFAHLLPVKLKPDNYLYWRAQILPLLRSHYLEGFVDGSLPCPSPTHPMYRSWVAQDQAILSAIQSSLSEGVAGLVLFAATSRDAWAALDSSLSSQSMAQSMAIRTMLGDTKKLDLSITAYFNKVKKLADTLASIGEPLRDTEFTGYILNGLDGDYDSIVEVIKERTVPIRPQELYSRLLSTEQRLSTRRPDVLSDNTSANAAYRGGGKPAYHPTAAPSPGGGKVPPAKQQQTRSVIIEGGRPRACCTACGASQPCQLCGIEGHVASRCHRRFKPDFMGLGTMGKAMSVRSKWRSMVTPHLILLMHPGTWILELLIM